MLLVNSGWSHMWWYPKHPEISHPSRKKYYFGCAIIQSGPVECFSCLRPPDPKTECASFLRTGPKEERSPHAGWKLILIGLARTVFPSGSEAAVLTKRKLVWKWRFDRFSHLVTASCRLQDGQASWRLPVAVSRLAENRAKWVRQMSKTDEVFDPFLTLFCSKRGFYEKPWSGTEAVQKSVPWVSWSGTEAVQKKVGSGTKRFLEYLEAVHRICNSS